MLHIQFSNTKILHYPENPDQAAAQSTASTIAGWRLSVIKWKTFSVLLAIYAGNSPVPGEFPTQKPVTRSFDVFFDLRLNKRLSK